MGLIPPPIPAAFLLFEVTSGLNFPFCTEHRGSLLGGWKGVSGPLLPPRLNTSKYCRSMTHKSRDCTSLYPDPDHCSSRQIRDDYWNDADRTLQWPNVCFDCRWTNAVSVTASNEGADHSSDHSRDKVRLTALFDHAGRDGKGIWLPAERKSYTHYSSGLYWLLDKLQQVFHKRLSNWSVWRTSLLVIYGNNRSEVMRSAL